MDWEIAKELLDAMERIADSLEEIEKLFREGTLYVKISKGD